MRDQLIKAINIFIELYPDYQIEFVFLWTVRDNMITYRIKGVKGVREVIDTIKIDL